MGENMVAIDVEEFARLVRNDMLLDMLLDALFESARLSWDKDDISFDKSEIRGLVKLIRPMTYRKILTELQEKDKKMEETDGADD